MSRTPWLFLSSAFATLALAGSNACSSSSSGSNPPPPPPADAGPGSTLITTASGQVQGSALANARQFLNIPYAAPPLADLRWKAPADPAPWTGVRDATAIGPACPQYNLLSGAPANTDTEDCLQLNVWSPLASTTKAPVMVWLHGGGFVSGTGTDLLFNGANLAAAGNAIVVTINYRLGPFGFLAHPALVADSPSANVGALDQRKALQWVSHNAAAFGGDPSNVTLFGESAGAFSVCTQLAMPNSAGLFQRALMESGACSGPVYYALADATAQGNALATAVGCTDATTAAACLRGKSTTDILSALPIRQETIGPTGVLWGPVYGDPELPQLPLTALKAGSFPQSVPLLLGTNLHEGDLFTALYLGTVGAQDVNAIVTWMFGAANVNAVLAQYPASSYPSLKAELGAIVTDGIFACPTRRAARALTGKGGTAFLYQFTYPFQITLAPGAVTAHGFEMPFVWDNIFYGTRLGASDLPLSQAMQSYWTHFAATGDPNAGGAPSWPKYDATSDQNIVLDATITTATGTKKTECDFWDGLM